MNNDMRLAFEAFCKRTASPGASSSEYYWMLFQAGAAYNDALASRLAEARANAFQDALDCMRDRQARDHLAACLQDKYGVWWKTDSATHREGGSHG